MIAHDSAALCNSLSFSLCERAYISHVHPYADPHWYDNIYILHIRFGPYNSLANSLLLAFDHQCVWLTLLLAPLTPDYISICIHSRPGLILHSHYPPLAPKHFPHNIQPRYPFIISYNFSFSSFLHTTLNFYSFVFLFIFHSFYFFFNIYFKHGI